MDRWMDSASYKMIFNIYNSFKYICLYFTFGQTLVDFIVPPKTILIEIKAFV